MKSVVSNTLATMVGFPDRTLYVEEVIWSGDAATGFFSSHRILSQMTNLGCSQFGNPTGRRATVRTIADCEVRQNRIGREWLVRDNFGLVWQLGLNPHTVARAQVQADAEAGTRWVDVMRRVLEQVPEEATASPTSALAEKLCNAFDRIWNGRMLSEVSDLYTESAAAHGCSGRELHGPHAIIGNILLLLGTLPDARLVMDQCTEIAAARGGTSSALRWRLAGTHSRPGLYGPASGKKLLLPGISHFRIVANRIEEEWTVFDELGVFRQIYSVSGDRV